MLRKKIMALCMTIAISLSLLMPAFAAEETVMEYCGAYLFEWRPVDCGDGKYFAILVGGNTISEEDVILRRGYDYAYTFNPQEFSRPWGTVPDLVNINGVWGIPENQAQLPEGSQPTLQIVLTTNNKNLSTDKRYVNVVHLPGGINRNDLPAEVRKYLINVDSSDAGAYEGTVTSGWVQENGQQKYRKYDGTFIINSWLNVDDHSYYLDANGIMLTDTITPDGIYVNERGEKTNYIPGWYQDEKGWRYIQKNGYYAGATWIQGNDGKWYYLNIGTYMETDDVTPDGYYVDANGVWDGHPSTISNEVNLGPGMAVTAGWELVGNNWRYKQKDGTYVTNAWEQINGNWYYFDENAIMATNQETPDGYYVNTDGVWVQS